jgi:hypothetical protein
VAPERIVSAGPWAGLVAAREGDIERAEGYERIRESFMSLTRT